jgi:hypothetical protein
MLSRDRGFMMNRHIEIMVNGFEENVPENSAISLRDMQESQPANG